MQPFNDRLGLFCTSHEMIQLIIYRLNCIRSDQNATSKTGLKHAKTIMKFKAAEESMTVLAVKHEGKLKLLSTFDQV